MIERDDERCVFCRAPMQGEFCALGCSKNSPGPAINHHRPVELSPDVLTDGELDLYDRRVGTQYP